MRQAWKVLGLLGQMVNPPGIEAADFPLFGIGFYFGFEGI